VAAGKGGTRVTYPGTLSETVEAELVSDLGGVHGILQMSVFVSR
jgi:hypothetical protein